jgi:hypothetical protein
LRDNAIRYVYEQGASQPNWDVPARQVQDAIGATKQDFDALVLMLHTQGMLAMGQMNHIGLSPKGQQEAERLDPITSWSEASRPPAPPIIVSNTEQGAVVQINTGANSTQTVTVNQDDARRLEALAEIIRQVETAGLSQRELAEVRDGLATLQSAITDQRPTIIPVLASAVAGTLKSAGSSLGSGLATRLLSLFG